MATVINAELYNKVRKDIMLPFCSNMSMSSTTDSELANRTMFITNLMSGFNNLDINDDVVAESFNTFLENISNYRINLKDIYDAVGTMTFNIYQIVDFFNYIAEMIGRTTETESMYNIYISVAKSTNSGIMDLMNAVRYSEVEDYALYLKPKLELSYMKSDKSFASILDIMRDVYVLNTSWSTSINANVNVTNKELSNFYSIIKTSFKTKKCILLKINSESYYGDILKFIKNFKYTDGDSIAEILINNVYDCDKERLLIKLAMDCYKYHAQLTNSYEYRDKPFNASTAFDGLILSSTKDIKFEDFKYELLKANIQNKPDDIITYCKEVKRMQTYLNNIYSSVTADKRYTLEV